MKHATPQQVIEQIGYRVYKGEMKKETVGHVIPSSKQIIWNKKCGLGKDECLHLLLSKRESWGKGPEIYLMEDFNV